jgi:hypothetical protein
VGTYFISGCLDIIFINLSFCLLTSKVITGSSLFVSFFAAGFISLSEFMSPDEHITGLFVVLDPVSARFSVKLAFSWSLAPSLTSVLSI